MTMKVFVLSISDVDGNDSWNFYDSRELNFRYS